MTTHNLKIWPQYFDAVRSGAKPYELRKDDRPYADGDMLYLREWSPATEAYTGHAIERRVTHVLRGSMPGLEPGYVLLGLGRKGR